MLPLIALFISLFSGLLGIMIGNITAYSISNRGKRFEGIVSGFTGGLMLSIIYMDIFPEAFQHSGLWVTFSGIIIGLVFLIIAEHILEHRISKHHYNEALKVGYLKTALLIAIALAFHNIPEGIAIGSLVSRSLSKGLKFGAVITIHNIPEGLMIAIPFKKSGVTLKKTLFISIIISLFMGIGGYIGCWLSSVSTIFLGLSLGIAGGIMLYITCGEILMKSTEKWRGRSVIVSVIIGVLLGIVISY